MQDTIERSISVAAPLERVWNLVTEPGWWVPSDSGQTAEPRPGNVVVRESQKWGRFPVEVVDVRPMTYVAFRWASTFPGEDLAPGRSTLIEFTLTPGDDEVEVRVVESGFAGLDAPENVRDKSFESNTDGWRQELESLRNRAQAT
jgi:uncharacterized protein YndB with AHSA1/START domain